MNRALRLVLLVLACFALPGFAGTAFAAYNPSLLIAGTEHAIGRGGPVVIGMGQNANDDATGMATLYAPVGYTVTLNQPVGRQLGNFSGFVKVAARGGATVEVTGTVKTDNPANYVTNTCAPGAHEAVWILEFTVAGNTFRIPLFVDHVTTGPEAAYASAKLQICFSSPYVPPPQGAPQGASILVAAFGVEGVFKNPGRSGAHAWNGIFVPYTPGTASLNTTNGAQSTSFVRLPLTFGMKAKRQKRGKRTFAVVTACVKEAGQAIRGIRVNVFGGRTIGRAKRLGSARTNARGCATTRIRIRKTILLFANTDVPARAASGCTPTLAPRCSAPSIAPAFDLFTRAVRVRR